MKRFYITVTVREGDMLVAPDKHTIESIDARETLHFSAILTANTGKALSAGAFEAAVAAIKEVTGQ